MRYRLLGGSGLRVSELALGTMGFGEPKLWGTPPETAARILALYADAGGTFLDTAPNYADGAAEEIIGKFLTGCRDDLVVATKYTASNSRHILAGGNSRKSLKRSVEASLRRLQTDHIDLLWLHYWDETAPMQEILRALDDLVTAGKILYVGISDTPAWLISRALTLADLRGWIAPVAIQIEYNLASRSVESDFLPMADALDLGVVCWGPLAAGALAGGSDPRRRKPDTVPPTLAAVAVELASISTETGHSPVSLALRWLLHRPTGCTLIPVIGARTEEQLQANLGMAGGGPLAPALHARLTALAPAERGFPHGLIESSHLRRLALGQPEALEPPARRRS